MLLSIVPQPEDADNATLSHIYIPQWTL